MTAWFVYIERKLEIRMKINKDDLNEELLNKLKKLETYIESFGSLAVGFSGGLHGNIARIEVPAKDIQKLVEEDIRESVYKRFTDLGFKFVTIDMKGYRLGSMYATLNNGK